MLVYIIKHHVIQTYGKLWIWLQISFQQAIFYFLTVVNIKISDLLDVTPRSLA